MGHSQAIAMSHALSSICLATVVAFGTTANAQTKDSQFPLQPLAEAPTKLAIPGTGTKGEVYYVPSTLNTWTSTIWASGRPCICRYSK